VATELPPPNFHFWQVKAGSKSLGICHIFKKNLVLTDFRDFEGEFNATYWQWKIRIQVHLPKFPVETSQDKHFEWLSFNSLLHRWWVEA
jgi:hypothetical protein